MKTRSVTSYGRLGHLVIPFEVVRRRGLWQPRADGLGKLFPEEFQVSKTGDYFVGGVWNARGYWIRQQEAATAFARFLRKVCNCPGFLQHTGWPKREEGVNRWEFVVAPKFARGNNLVVTTKPK